MVTAERAVLDTAERYWWLGIASGVLYLILGFVVLSYDAASVKTVAVLIGISFIFTGIAWLAAAPWAESMKWWFVAGGALSIAAGIVAFAYPGPTLEVIGLLLGWFLLFAGLIDIVVSFSNRHRQYWWVGLIQGLLMVGLAVWAAGEDDRTIFLLLTLTGVALVFRGVGNIMAAFVAHNLRRVT